MWTINLICIVLHCMILTVPLGKYITFYPPPQKKKKQQQTNKQTKTDHPYQRVDCGGNNDRLFDSLLKPSQPRKSYQGVTQLIESLMKVPSIVHLTRHILLKE